MNYLQLCQRVHLECGLSGSGPQAVTNQTGVNAKIVSWVAQAWNELQMRRPDWKWLWAQDTLALVPGQREYDLPADFDHLIPGLTRLDGAELEILPYQDLRMIPSATGRPYAAAVTPADRFLLLSEPTEAGTLTFEYIKTPQQLVSVADIPALPGAYHIAIVYLAVTKYAAHDDHGQLFQDAKYNWEYWFGKLVDRETIGAVTLGAPLDAY